MRLFEHAGFEQAVIRAAEHLARGARCDRSSCETAASLSPLRAPRPRIQAKTPGSG